MLNLIFRPQDEFGALKTVALAIVKQYLSHERRHERIAILNDMLKKLSDSHDNAEITVWVYALHRILWAYYDGGHHTHTDVKNALRLFAEICDQAIEAFDATIVPHDHQSGNYTVGGRFPRISGYQISTDNGHKPTVDDIPF